MLPISDADIELRIQRDNPWWSDATEPIPEATFPKRMYFRSLVDVALDFSVRRATIMLGPRRVGKTFMIKQLVDEAIRRGIDSRSILYVSVDTPVHSGISLEQFLSLMPRSLTRSAIVIPTH